MAPAPAKAGKAKALVLDEHNLTFEQFSERYSVQFNASKPNESAGLSPDEAARRLAADGPNMMSPPVTKSALTVFLECLASLFNLLLVVAAIFTYVLFGLDTVNNYINVYTGSILLGVAFLNSFIEFYQIQKSAAILKSFLNMIPAKATAVRAGQLVNVPAGDLVKGDIVFVRMGDKVPADVWLFKTTDMKVDNSSLTGEAEPQERKPIKTHDNPLETANLAFNSSLVVAGEGFGIVIRTGDDTVIGQIAGMTNSEKKRPSPLNTEIENFVKIIGTIAILTGIIFFIVSLAQGRSLGNSFNFAVGVLVAWVPEGLPATVTMLLTIAAKRMAAQNVLVKDLKGVETLGAMTMLATDKTGTLTRNQMTVANVWTQLKMFSTVPDVRALVDDEVMFDSSVPGVQDVLNISALCSRARFNKTDVPIDQREILGDATETGLYRLATQKVRDFDTLNDRNPKVFEIPFNSDTKWHMSIHTIPHATGTFTLFIKGAPERVLRICSTILGPDGEPIPLTDEHKATFTTSYEYMAGKGHRVLAFAKLLLPGTEYPETHVFSKEEKNYPTTNLTFVGLASLEDPPKHGVREAVGHCRKAGVKVVMVTGDHPLTAEAIGRKINLMISDTKEKMAKKAGVPESEVNEDDVKAIVIHGERIDSLTDADWDLIFSKEEIIFARTSPKHKLQIVKHAQSIGHIVGVTGDGVNDSPALKKADLGIAMNMSGSDVSKEAAAMILLDDNFASIINGIREGRLIFSNLKKSIQYVVTHSIPEVVPQLLYVVAPLPAGLNALQIIMIDLGFELFAALSYAWEPPESEGLMKLLPRKPVDADSIEHLRARRAFDAQFKLVRNNADVEHSAEDDAEEAVRELTFRERMARLASGEYWSKWMFAKEDGEVLVDAGVLSWAYLEAGIIEYIGAQIAFFYSLYLFKDPATGIEYPMTPTDAHNCAKAEGFQATSQPCTLGNGQSVPASAQTEMLSQAQAIWYLTVTFAQMFNLFACKFRMTSPFNLKKIVNNKSMLMVVPFGVLFGFFIAYCPGIDYVFGTSRHTNAMPLWVSVVTGVVVYLYAGLRFWIKSRLNPLTYSPEPLGLQMHPTRWSRISRS
ncbi:Na,H/K antiporter P-type ATPase, alpha subunit [Allomyces macrogynus ATCC 38327]|uniref:Na,H/K antiporter P-type ATPase, alpha subunit n=1 Tax=Allomyces macrogynus (strain ATCC 38327) TaxID=578462 RepID=A0A0L0S2R2_ALLM3|nr:Na,H/K antiporter P-type ATPase, alpha subunit [Allomyces macrogynus ATCC 38327]|eukprot:KNE56654.1 Na,H/K antiporter P-type ATPase, alpha subunit [Allomyces macrogynus ATCC 38327]